MESAITAIGTANPRFQRPQMETAELIIAGLKLKPAEKRLLKSVYKATGIEKRHSVLSDYCKSVGEFEFFPNDPESPYPSTSARMKVYKDNALNLAKTAIDNCLKSLNHSIKNEITHLITISCTGMYAPGIDIELAQQLHLNSNIKRTAINFMGCYGAFNGIKVADAICKSDPHAKVLMVCVELCTIHFQKDVSIMNMISNSIFADGAAAVLIQAKPEKQKCFILNSFYCDLLPQTSQEMAWHIADFGFDIVLSTYVPEVIQSGIGEFTKKLLNQSGWTLNEIDFYAIHPGGLKILQACEKALNITEEDNKYSYDVLKNYGNMSSPTVLFVLKNIWDNISKKDSNKNIFSCAFGPGLTLESMMLKTFNF
jgi:alpha-pyrone synthase